VVAAVLMSFWCGGVGSGGVSGGGGLGVFLVW